MRPSVLTALLVLCSSPVHAGDSSVGGKFVPPSGQKLLFIGQDNSAFHDYVRDTGSVPAGFMVYTSVQDPSGLDSDSPPSGGIQNARGLLDSYPDTMVQIGLWMAGNADDILDGHYDGNIDFIADWIKNSGRPVFLRIGYEFDFPENNYHPDDYVRTYRHVADRIRSRKTPNVAFVWHSYGVLREIPVSNWYPGDGYVDWFAVSYFAQGPANMGRMVKFARDRGKPLMIAEATPFGSGVLEGEKSWNHWFKPFFRFIREKDVKAVCYINWDWEQIPMFRGKGWGNCRVQDNPLVFDRWKTETSDPSFLHSSTNLFKSVGFLVQPEPAAK